MRLWLNDNERRPDPTPVQTDDRKAIVVGLAFWLVGLIMVLAFRAPLAEQGHGWWLVTCWLGLALGAVGLVYTHARRRRE